MSMLLLVRPLLQKIVFLLTKLDISFRMRALPLRPHGVQGTVIVHSYVETFAYHLSSRCKYYTVIFGVSRGA
jgi:hypothetical protein